MGLVGGQVQGQTIGYYTALALVTTVLTVRAVGLLHHSLSIPLAYAGDAFAGGALFKGVMERGWYEFNPHLGALGASTTTTSRWPTTCT